MVTIHSLSVLAGATLKLEKEPQGSSGQIVQIVLGSFKIEAGAALSVGDNIRVTLNDSNMVGGIFRLGSTVIVDKGAEIQGSDGGKIFIDDGVIVFIDKENNNFYKKVGNDLYEKIEGSITNPPTGSFFWGSTGWMENVEYYPKNLEEFFKAEYSTTYTV
ncbi:MAG: hypothetical protein LBL70_05305, partial [Treponema sp.]|nr:hypothetical protein [Treponema sp.]